jgi:hypothetical protein
MRLGFTGTQKGLSIGQVNQLQDSLRRLQPVEVHHGDCLGADTEFHLICVSLKVPLIVIHPCDIPAKRANCHLREHSISKVVVLPVKAPLERNQDIVRCAQKLLACPYDRQEQLRSGTWATVRYARRLNKPVELIHGA